MELRQYSEVSDNMGGYIKKWTGKRQIEGVLTSIRGNERLSQDRKTVVQTHRFYIDYPKALTITEKDRFIFGSTKFDIVLIEDLGGNQNTALRITLKERR